MGVLTKQIINLSQVKFDKEIDKTVPMQMIDENLLS